MELNLRIHDPSGTVRRDVRLQTPDGSTVRDVVEALTDLFVWPRETMGGEAVTYAVRRLGEVGVLDSNADIAGLDLHHGDALVFGPIQREDVSA